MLGVIGNTPVVKLSSKIVGGDDCADVFIKLEMYNPTGSYKDRMALAMIEEAEKRGDLKAGDSVVEYTGGSTGVSLAFVCAVKGYPCIIVSNDVVAAEKIKLMRIFGARVDIVEASTPGKLSADLIPKMMERARVISLQQPSYFTNQMQNKDMIFGYAKIGRELSQQQIIGPIDVFCACTGTAGMLVGTAKELLRADPNRKTRFVAFEPSTSAVLTGGAVGSHSVEGVAPGFVPPLFDRNVVRECRTVDESEGRAMVMRLAREEGLFVGTSTGLNVVGAIKIAKEMGKGKTVVTVACDSGLKYMNGTLFSKL
jgi:cysteine synthase A